jgi:hypothetical protein
LDLHFSFKILMLTAPIVYWWTETSVIDATASNLIYWLAPSAVGSIIFIGFYSRKFVLPVMTDLSQLLPSLVIVQTVIAGLTRPFGRPFKVTPKGWCSGGTLILWTYLLPFALAALATFLGILINTSSYSDLNVEPGFAVNVFWSIYNITILLLAVVICIELPQRRQDVRLPAQEQAVIRRQGESDSVWTIANISLGGARISDPLPAWAKEGEEAVLLLDCGAGQVPFRFVRLDQRQGNNQGFSIAFNAESRLRRTLTTKLFTGAYRWAFNEISVPRVLFAVGKRLLR